MKIAKNLCALILTLLMLVGTAACGGKTENTSSEEAASSKGFTFSRSASSQEKTEEKKVKYYSTDIWQQVPLVSQAILNSGRKGGEGCQWMTWVTFDRIDGKTAYGGVDVGGLVKSTDGGKSWYQSAIGLKAHGATGIAVDPFNVKRVIAIGCDSGQNDNNGLYLSTDEGESWQPKCLMKVNSSRDYRYQVAFDESSYDKSAGYCKTIYWCTEDISGIAKGIYKSTDGGETWKIISGTTEYAGGDIAVHPKSGEVYFADSKHGLMKSTDGGKTWKNAGLTEKLSSMYSVNTQPDKLYITGYENFYVYDCKSGKADKLCGRNDGSGYPPYAAHIAVSPSEPNKMVLQADYLAFAGQYNSENYYSVNGGKTWAKATNDYSGAFMPYNARQNPACFHPKDSNIVIKLGGDFIMRSTDGGKSYQVSNDGNNAIYVGGKYNFNPNNYYLSIASQDYNGGYTLNGGKTWTYVNWSGLGWGGYTYGSYMLDDKTAVCGVSESWGADREICVTHDGGKTIEHTGIITKGAQIGCGALGNTKIAFYAEYFTTDGGYTWKKMNGCTQVMCVDPKEGKLFGVNQNVVVMSNDNGMTWETVTANGGSVSDMAYNHETKTLYISGSTFFAFDLNTNKIVSMSTSNLRNMRSIACDPGKPEIMYAVITDWSSAATDSAYRSVDGGKTWIPLNRRLGDGRDGTPDGGRTADFVRVNKNGDAFFSTNCRGIWKMARPDLKELEK